MKRSAWLLSVALLPLGCAGLPTPTPEDLPRVTGKWPNVKLEDLVQGRKLLVENCASCHVLHVPSEFNEAQWERVMVKMQKKAKIDDPEKDSILSYLKAFAQEPTGVPGK